MRLLSGHGAASHLGSPSINTTCVLSSRVSPLLHRCLIHTKTILQSPEMPSDLSGDAGASKSLLKCYRNRLRQEQICIYIFGEKKIQSSGSEVHEEND